MGVILEISVLEAQPYTSMADNLDALVILSLAAQRWLQEAGMFVQEGDFCELQRYQLSGENQQKESV